MQKDSGVWSTLRRDVVNTQWLFPFLFCLSIEMKTLWVQGMDFREVEDWGQNKV